LPRLRISSIYHTSERVHLARYFITYRTESLVYEPSHRPRFISQPDTAKEVMWYTLHLLIRDLVRDDWETFIKLHGVPVDDFAIVLAR
jgi:hypothetical protein